MSLTKREKELKQALERARSALKAIHTWSVFAVPARGILRGDALDHIQTEKLTEKALAESRVEGVT